MSRIKLSRKTHKQIKKIQSSDETLEDTINRLLDETEERLVDDETIFGETQIILSKETMERIKSFQVKGTESYDSILFRALNLYTNDDK